MTVEVDGRKLRRCPFCGSLDLDIVPSDDGKNENVVCEGCGGSGGEGRTSEAAATAWNRRTIFP
jgi:Lar family restriction alleviation protein